MPANKDVKAILNMKRNLERINVGVPERIMRSTILGHLIMPEILHRVVGV